MDLRIYETKISYTELLVISQNRTFKKVEKHSSSFFNNNYLNLIIITYKDKFTLRYLSN